MSARARKIFRISSPSALISCLAICRAACADDFIVDTWRFDDDLPRDGIYSIAQGNDGYLWVSSRYGLARYDGVRFVNVNSRVGAQFVGHHFANLKTGIDGDVWIGTPGNGLAKWKNGGLLPCLSPGAPELGPVFAGFTNAQGRELAVTPDGRVLGWSNGSPHLIVDAGRWGGVVGPSLCNDLAGRLWFVTYEHRLVRVNGTNAEERVFGTGEARRNWVALSINAAGELWAGTQLGIGIWRGEEFEAIEAPNDAPLPVDDVISVPTVAPEASRAWVIAQGRAWLLEGTRWITNVLFEPSAGLYETSPRMVDRAGNLWFTTTKSSLVRASAEGSLTILSGADGVPPGRVAALLEDREGSLWVGIQRAGLARLRPRYFNPIGTREGFKAPAVWAVIEDSAGAIWLGTEGAGVQRWQDSRLTEFNLADSGIPGSVYSLCLDREGRVWAGTGDNRVFRFENGKFVLIWEDAAPGWNKRVYAICEDRPGRMWFGTGMGLFRWEDGEVRRLSGRGFASGVVRVVCEDATGRIWVGRSGGSDMRLAYVEGDELVAPEFGARLGQHDVFGLHAEADGSLWIATVGGGLWRHRDGELRQFAAKDGLPEERIFSVAPDAAGNLWLASPSGIIHVAKDSIEESDARHAESLDCLLFNRTDGLPTRECSGGTQPVISRARNGRLLFALAEGAVAVSPERIKINSHPPPVLIEDVRVDGRSLDRDEWRVASGANPRHATLATRNSLGPGRHVVEFQFTATSLVAPAKVRFKYRLNGVDDTWREPDASRSAQYTLTLPGNYRFRVIASNNDGVWNESGAELALTVPPFFWQTWTFRIAAGAGVLLAVGGTIRFVERRNLRRKLEQFEMEQRIERERARIARDIHDELGANLTEIGLLSEFAQSDSAAPEEIRTDVQKIAAKAANSTRALDEIVWAVNPRNDTVEGFVQYACAYAEEHLRLAHIGCRLDVASPLPQRSLRADVRHHLFLAFKEALNNVVKHARASEVELRFAVDGDRMSVLINDNGCGFDPVKPSARNGLRNLKERLENAGGAFEFDSAPGRGTRIKLVMKLD